MLPVSLHKFFLFLVLHVLMTNTAEVCEESVIMACVDNTTCTQTYGEVYNMLASQKNYHNIAEALYPAKSPSSVLVHITLYGANETENCTPAAYTWSMLCLYAAFPPIVLEILSWGSIIVSSRTQELKITIPPFCCNVSKDDRIAMIDNLLAALQDLAVSPGMQDPRLNTAECVTEGHKPKLTCTGRSTYLIATMWFSCIFTIFCGPWLAIGTLIFFDNFQLNTENKNNNVAIGKAVKVASWLMLFVESALLITVVVCLACHYEKAHWHIFSILIILVLEGLLLGVCLRNECCAFLPEYCKCCNISGLQISTFMWANLTAYNFCWLVIGIMLNALWGVTVLLFVCVIIAACIFLLYHYYLYRSENTFSCQNFFVCLTIFLAIGSLVAVVVLAGQSGFGRDTTDDVVKAVTLSISTAFFSWMLSTMKGDDKSKVSKKKKENNKNTNGIDNEERVVMIDLGNDTDQNNQ